MLDDALKTVIIDESLPVSMIVHTICEKIGISNPDEYSLLPDTPPPEKKEKKDKKDKNITEEGISYIELFLSYNFQYYIIQFYSPPHFLARWLNPDKTLAEQFVLETDVVILKKKFFFTDQNIDKNDPVQLNLLYNQGLIQCIFY